MLAWPGRSPRRTAQWLGAQAVAGVLFLPWPLNASRALPDLAVPGGALPPLDPVQHAARFLWTTLVEWSAGRTLTGPVAAAIAIFGLFLAILGAISPALARRARGGLALGLTLALLVLLLLPRTATYFSPKYLIVATPAFYLLLAAGLQTLRRLAPRLWLGCLLLLAAGWGVALADWFLLEHVKVAWQTGPIAARALHAVPRGRS